MKRFKEIMAFLRLVDEKQQLSLTNLSIYLILGKLLTMPQLALPEVGAFLTVLMSYNFKRYITQPDAPEDVAILKEQLAKLQTSVSAVQMANGLKPRQ